MADIAIRGATKIYAGGAVPAVDAVDLDIADGELLVLVGPSGCGKSTLLRMIAGLEEVTAGSISIGGRDVTYLAPKDRDVAMVFQSYALYPHMTVRRNIGYPLKLAKTPKDELDRRVEETAELLQLTDELERRPAQLSGGQRQRVAMGRAIVRHPHAFLMDEPLSNLDAKLRVEMRAEIARLQRELAVTTVYVTHDQVEAMTMGTRVAVMQHGVLEQVGPPQEVYDRPASLFVAQFLGTPAMNVFQPGMLEPGDRLVGVRPEHIQLDREGPLTGRVFLVEALGYERLITCVLPNEVRVVARTSSLDGPREGEAVFIGAEPRHRLHFDPVTGKRLER